MRSQWGYIAFGLVADAFLAFVFVEIVGGKEKLFAFFWLFVTILVAQLLASIWGALKMWGAYRLFNRDKLIRLILADFYRSDMPSTKAHVSMDAYLSDTRDDKELPFKQRAKAAALLGEAAAYRAIRPFTTGMMMAMAFENAMERYTKPLPGRFDEDQFEEEFFRSMQESKSEPTATPTPATPSAPKSRVIALSSRPWPRFWARLIDLLLFSLLISTGAVVCALIYAPSLYLQMNAMNVGIWNFLITPIVCIVLAFCMATFGTTPGKALLSVTVPVPDAKGRVAFYVRRELKVWALGLGLGLPVFNLFQMGGQQRRLIEGKPASYDEGKPPVTANPSAPRLAIGVLTALILFSGVVYLRVEEQKVDADAWQTQLWTNPITNKSVEIGKIWQPQELKTNSGRAFYFGSPTLIADAVFGYEQIGGGDITNYAIAIQNAISSEVTITSDWAPAVVNGMKALRASGKSISSNDTFVEVTVALDGQNAWRALVFTRGRPAEQFREKDAFTNSVFRTAK